MENDILRPQLLFVPKSSQMTEYYWFQEGFSKSEIDIILENMQSLPFQEARVAADRKGDDLKLNGFLRILISSGFMTAWQNL
jgi:hypothetical protein